MGKLFIIAQGRSGSTLLQQIINKTTDYKIYGENDGFFIKLAELVCSISLIECKSDYQKSIKTNKPSWINDINSVNLYNKIKQVSYEFLPLEHHGGFKEIRYGLKDYDYLCHNIDFLKELYPKSKFIFLKRELNELIKSGWWTEKEFDLLKNQQELFIRYCAENKTLLIDYKQLCKNDLTEVYSYIDAKYERSKVAKILEIKLED